jgi:hypothetical protein
MDVRFKCDRMPFRWGAFFSLNSCNKSINNFSSANSLLINEKKQTIDILDPNLCEVLVLFDVEETKVTDISLTAFSSSLFCSERLVIFF